MPQVIKKRIVLASVLKPVTDTRMFEKLGRTLAMCQENDVHLIGFPAKVTFAENISFHSIYTKPFKRLSLKRLLAPLKILIIFFRLRPNTIIITTHELLLQGVLYKLLTGTRLYYDVQENYYYNIRYTSAFPVLLRFPLAAYVRLKELLLSRVVDYYFLAEKGYYEELQFARPCVVLENKLSKAYVAEPKNPNRLHFLFTGTLAETTGVLEAIRLVKELHRLNDQVQLTIIGHVTTKKFLDKLNKMVADSTFIHLTANLFPIPHTSILHAISIAGTGIIIYPTNPSTRSSVPTKLYEYLGMKLPVLIRHNEPSHQLVKQCKGGIILSENPDYQKLINNIKTLGPPLPDEALYWESEAHKLTRILN